jgi:hypothetical protein
LSKIADLSRIAQEAQKVLQDRNHLVDVLTKAARVPHLDALNSALENSAILRTLEDFQRHEAVMRAAEGPLAELRPAVLFDLPSPLQKEIQRIREMAAFELRFSLPDPRVAEQLLQQLQASPLSEAMTRFGKQIDSLERAMQAMRTPWLDAQEPLRSVAGFAELHGIASMLTRLPTFDEHVVTALRIGLGDWRDPIAWSDNIFTDLAARTGFYVDRGFDPALTDFPAPAFQESLDVLGLRGEPPPLVALYGPLPRLHGDEEEEALVRTNVAHDWLLRLEYLLRKFIDDRMTTAFGTDWPKHRLPKDLYEKWRVTDLRHRNLKMIGF